MKPYGRSPGEVREALRSGDLTVAVYGLGKMGLPLAAVIADAGALVLGVDTDPRVVNSVNAGRCHVEREPGLPEMVARAVRERRLRAGTDGVAAARGSDVQIVLVPTLLDRARRPDLSAVRSVARLIAKGAQPGSLVIQESTVPPGTVDGSLSKWLSGRLAPGRDIGLAYCPERTSSGHAVRDITESYPKVIGGIDAKSVAAASGLYESINAKGVIPVSSARVAEAVKVFEGVYRDVNIALANELAIYSEVAGIDVREAIRVANTQPYSHLLLPGVGVGGHCIPVYPYFLMGKTKTPLLKTARRVNDGMPAHTVSRLREGLRAHGRKLAGSRVLVLGLSYRAGVAEIRYAPSVALVRLLQRARASVAAHDPVLAPSRVPALRVREGDPGEPGQDAIVIATDHVEYRSLDWPRIVKGMRTPLILDGRGLLSRSIVEAAGGSYLAVGLSRESTATGGSARE